MRSAKLEKAARRPGPGEEKRVIADVYILETINVSLIIVLDWKPLVHHGRFKNATGPKSRNNRCWTRGRRDAVDHFLWFCCGPSPIGGGHYHQALAETLGFRNSLPSIFDFASSGQRKPLKISNVHT